MVQGVHPGSHLHRHLKHFDFNANSIADRGCLYLCGALNQNTSMTKLELENNNITDQGGQALLEMLKTNNSIMYLPVKHNRMAVTTGVGREGISRALKVSDGQEGCIYSGVLTRASPNTATPCFCTFELFFETIVFAFPLQSRVCRLCAGCREGQYGCQRVIVGVILCALVFWGVCWPVGHPFVVMKG